MPYFALFATSLSPLDLLYGKMPNLMISMRHEVHVGHERKIVLKIKVLSSQRGHYHEFAFESNGFLALCLAPLHIVKLLLYLAQALVKYLLWNSSNKNVMLFEESKREKEQMKRHLRQFKPHIQVFSIFQLPKMHSVCSPNFA